MSQSAWSGAPEAPEGFELYAIFEEACTPRWFAVGDGIVLEFNGDITTPLTPEHGWVLIDLEAERWAKMSIVTKQPEGPEVKIGQVWLHGRNRWKVTNANSVRVVITSEDPEGIGHDLITVDQLREGELVEEVTA